MDLGAFIEASNLAADSAALFDAYCVSMAASGFDRLYFYLLTDHPMLGLRARHGMMRNYPAGWLKLYAERRLEEIDPVRQQLFIADSAFSWASLPNQRKLAKAQIEYLRMAELAGLKNGISIPLRGPRGVLASISAAGTAEVMTGDAIAMDHIFLMAQQFYRRFRAIEKKPQQQVVITLSMREREVLKWCAAGKTKGEIGSILSISEDAVKFHISNLRQKLGASNVATAVIKAVNTGIIQL